MMAFHLLHALGFVSGAEKWNSKESRGTCIHICSLVMLTIPVLRFCKAPEVEIAYALVQK
jgi:hypothetical protein